MPHVPQTGEDERLIVGAVNPKRRLAAVVVRAPLVEAAQRRARNASRYVGALATVSMRALNVESFTADGCSACGGTSPQRTSSTVRSGSLRTATISWVGAMLKRLRSERATLLLPSVRASGQGGLRNVNRAHIHSAPFQRVKSSLSMLN
jgi:hypothetical protein